MDLDKLQDIVEQIEINIKNNYKYEHKMGCNVTIILNSGEKKELYLKIPFLISIKMIKIISLCTSIKCYLFIYKRDENKNDVIKLDLDIDDIKEIKYDESIFYINYEYDNVFVN